MLSVSDYTKTSDPLLNHLNEKFPDGICVSDIQDTLGQQYVDLVQEGGGVHGIALAGYTYVLEKMGISFMKMAGTSAGSINTLLLNAVNTKKEAERLGLNGEYYETRSEKVLEYLSEQELKDFVDGPGPWKNLLLGIFSPDFKKKGVKGFFNKYKRLLLLISALLILLILTGFFMIFHNSGFESPWPWVFIISFLGAVIAGLVLFLRIRYARTLFKLLEKFGINPGDNFENWVVNILKENQISSIADLNKKLEHEKAILNPVYMPCRAKRSSVLPEELSRYNSLISQIEDSEIRVELLYDPLCVLLHQDNPWKEEVKQAFWNRVIEAFEVRLGRDTIITKEIVIVSSDIIHGLKVEFPGMHKMYWGEDYTISPAKYVRASMSVPVFFRPMEILFEEERLSEIKNAWSHILKVQNDPGAGALFVDGGLLSNFPINVFYNASMPVPRKPTFGIKLEYENEIASNTISGYPQFGGAILNTMRFFYDRDFALKQDIYKKTVRSVDTGKVHWLNFNLSDEEKLELFFRGALAATIFLSRYKTSDEEIRKLEQLGLSVPIQQSTFSIYGTGKVDFQIEDKLIPNIAFEWQSYKEERLIDRLSKEDRKAELKGSASTQNLK